MQMVTSQLNLITENQTSDNLPMILVIFFQILLMLYVAKLYGSIWIKCNKFIDELLNVCLTCRTHHSKCGAPLHAVGGPAPLLIILVA